MKRAAFATTLVCGLLSAAPAQAHTMTYPQAAERGRQAAATSCYASFGGGCERVFLTGFRRLNVHEIKVSYYYTSFRGLKCPGITVTYIASNGQTSWKDNRSTGPCTRGIPV